MSRGKTDAKQFALKRRKRRQWLTFVRMCRYGINNFSRNAWLTVAATAMMTLTLFVIFTAVTARNVLLDSVDAIRNKVDMSMYVRSDASEADIQKVTEKIDNLSSVRRVTFISSSDARQQYAEEHKNDKKALNALNLSEGGLPATLRVNVADINDTSELAKFADTDPTYQKIRDPDHDPSFAGEKRLAISNIGRWVSFAEKAGITASVILAVISSLIVFNTIRMAIFNRKEEIQMMKLIGADKGFIRGPFVVEAVVYGFIAAVIATGFGILALYSARPKLESYGIVVEPTLSMTLMYIGFVLPGMILIGALIGIMSSLFATRRYLKI